MVKSLTLVGARPQFMKLLPLSTEFAAAGIDEYVVHSGQHFSIQCLEPSLKNLAFLNPIEILATMRLVLEKD